VGIVGRVRERSLVAQKVHQFRGCGPAVCHVKRVVTSDGCARRGGEFPKFRGLVRRWGGDC